MPQEGKASPEEKLWIVEACLKGEIGIIAAAQQVGVSWESVRSWISRYRADGPSGLLPSADQRKYSPELKQTAVQEYMRGGVSLAGICEKHHIRSTRQLRNWIKVYNSGKDFKKRSGGSRMTKARKTTQEERIKIAKECLATEDDYGGIAQKYAVSYQQVYTWAKKLKAQGEAGLEDRRGQRIRQQEPRTPEEEYKTRIAQLEHENYMLKMERDLLKK